MRGIVALGLAALVVFAPGSARAEGERLGLVDPRANLREAVGIALEPWSIRIVDVPPPSPSATMPEAAREARVIAQRVGVDALAWVAADTLWMYDARTEQLVSRPIAGDPTDDAAAAALALTLKTVLRTTTIAPATEQIGAVTPPPPPARQFRLEVDGGVRFATIEERTIVPRVGLGLAFWPARLEHHLGAAVGLEEGLGFAVRTNEFRGRLGDHVARLALRTSLPIGGRYAVEPALGGSLHWTTLDGAPVDGRSPDLSRLDPSIDVSTALVVGLGHDYEVGIRFTGSLWTRWQRYHLGQNSSFETSPFQGGIALFLGAGLY